MFVGLLDIALVVDLRVEIDQGVDIGRRSAAEDQAIPQVAGQGPYLRILVSLCLHRMLPPVT
jgi:hypothetical protein